MWDIIKRKVERWDGESWFGLLLWMAFAGVLFVLFNLVTADKTVRCYYLHSTYTSAGISYQIKADIDYLDDTTAFSSADHNITMSVFEKLAQCPKDN